MFDEYVEHSTNAGSFFPPARSLPHLQYEGFEPAGDQDELAFEAGGAYGLNAYASQNLYPIFALETVQHTFPSALVSMTVSSKIITMAFKTNSLQQIDLDRAEDIRNITLEVKKGRGTAELSISKIFCDPTGRHVIIGTAQGENYYLFEGWSKARLLPKCKLVIESVAWNPAPPSKSSVSAHPRTSAREILLGGRNGTIYEMHLDAQEDIFKTPDRYVSPLYTFTERHPITGLHAEYMSSGAGGASGDSKRLVVLATSATRIYQFIGIIERKPEEIGKLYDPVFATYRDVAPKFLELQGNNQHSELHVVPKSRSVRTMAWMTGQGIYYGMLNLSAPSTSDIIESATLLPYPYSAPSSPTTPPSSPKLSQNPMPLSMLITDYHFLLLYPDRVCAVSNLGGVERLVYEEFLALKPSEKPLYLASDTKSKTYWVYSNSSMFEVIVNDEDRDVWKIYLEREDHEKALKYAKTASQRSVVNASLGDQYFKSQNYIKAAQCYAQSSRGFEEVSLSFNDIGESDALRYFLVKRLETMPKSMLIQRTMLASWLVEFYLGKLNTLDDLVAAESTSQDVDNLKAERDEITEELHQFLVTYKASLHKKTTYELIQSHGRTDISLHYAMTVGDYEKVVETYVMDEEWLKAVDVLNRQSDLNLFYRFSPVLMRHAPKETVESWLRRTTLDPHRLIPALLQTQHLPPSPLSPNYAVHYLNRVIFDLGSTSPMIHNLLLTFLASNSSSQPASSPTISSSKLPNGTTTPDVRPGVKLGSESSVDRPLLRFLSTAPKNPITSRPYYDLDYALRLCKRNNRLSACVHIYAQMEMWEDSVELALQIGDVELAKTYADKPEGDEILQKKLWLMTAKYVVQDKKDIKSAMQFLESTNVLKVEDILPFFPDFVVIDDFKDEVCNALEGYSARIEELKNEMNDATKTAEAIKRDMAELKKRLLTVEQNDKCASCELPLLTREFYVFPCQHTFHANCLIGQVKEYLPTPTLRRIVLLQDELMKLTGKLIEKPRHRQKAPSMPGMIEVPGHQRQESHSSATQPVENGPGGLLSSNFNRAVVAPAVAGRNAFVAAGAGLRDLVIPESLASAIASNINLGIPNVWGGNGGELKNGMTTQQLQERATKLKEELDELLAAACPLCESVVAGLDKPFVLPEERDRSWDL
ncbi:Pep3/Vps18/deep orange family-domain-containing protein [Cantharellus anzutake]|uniref:Pep3/Vps18/deep orange family-domain-containing protein n=1 Tax=Cantharellus anzutake TaxID=1750568 RepID=UPI001902DA0A|nr:Pep3/Vps18/deep orange family-domain-containing protein [Cantharellus anzutake]KAF8329689.1 Pep3/Vps18/deep orange family-domain-containing protein [Cantharellus anzutake]